MNREATSSNHPFEFISARGAIAAAQQAANRPSNEAPALPIAVKSPEGVGVLVFFLSNGGPTSTEISPPDVFVLLDHSGKVLKTADFEPQQIEAFRARTRDPKIGLATMLGVGDYMAKRKRFLDISPSIWAAFASDQHTASAATADLVSEYWQLFCAVTRESDAPYYLEASPAFFEWVRKLAK